MDEQENEFKNVLSEYYKLKKKYEGEYNKNKKQILNNPTLSMAKKKKEFAALKKKCVNCNRVGGSIFLNSLDTSNDSLIRLLSVKCGVTPDPCSLDISLQVAKCYSIKEEVDDLKKSLNFYKNQIIQMKNEILFNIKNLKNTVTKEKYENIKKEIIDKGDNYFSYKIILNEELENHLDKKEYNLKIEQFNDLIKQFKQLVDQYKKTGLEEEMNIITDFYIKNLIPLGEEIRNMKYRESDVNYNPDTKQYILDQNNYKEQFLEINLEQNKVLKFVKNIYNPEKEKKIKININKASDSLDNNRIGSQKTDSLVEFKIETPEGPPPGWNSPNNEENEENKESIDISNDIIDLNQNPDSLNSATPILEKT